MFINSTDFSTVKRFSTLEFDNLVASAPYDDHFRIRVLKMENGGAVALVFTSDPFVDGSSPEVFTLLSANDVGNNEIGVENSEFYRIDVVAFDAGETVEDTIDEHFLYVYPDAILTSGTAPNCGAIDSELFGKLLFMLGHNVLHGEYLNPAGYTQQRVIRGFGIDLTESEAQALLLTAEDPDDVDVVFKAKAVLTTADNGNELLSRQTEEPVP